MYDKDYKDLVGGGLMFLFGAFVVGYGLMTMSMGTPQRMGPGFFPISVGLLLTIISLGIFIPALLRKGTLEPISWRPLAAVLASLAAFAQVMTIFGLVAAIFALVTIATLGQSRIKLLSIVATTAFLSVMCLGIFNLGLGLGLPMIRWPL